MRRFLAGFLICAVILAAMTSCAGGNKREPTITAALGPPESALPYQAVFAIDSNADERLIAAAKNFCDRTVSLSNGGTVFSLVLSGDALIDLRSGRAELILLDSAKTSAFPIVSEAFRYRSYEHFSMSVNSAAALTRLSDMLEANVFAVFYTGSNVILSRGTLDSKFRPSRRDTENPQVAEPVPAAALSSEAARAFTLLGANVIEDKSLDARISVFGQNYSTVEFSFPELDSPALLQAIGTRNPEDLETEPVDGGESLSDNGGHNEDAEDLSESSEHEPLALARAFTGTESAWLVFSPSAYEKLSQTGRAVVAESAAYMTADIDRVYLEYERQQMDALLDEDVILSQDFTATRTRALRLADDAALSLSPKEKRLREAISQVR